MYSSSFKNYVEGQHASQMYFCISVLSFKSQIYISSQFKASKDLENNKEIMMKNKLKQHLPFITRKETYSCWCNVFYCMFYSTNSRVLKDTELIG